MALMLVGRYCYVLYMYVHVLLLNQGLLNDTVCKDAFFSNLIVKVGP